MATHARRDAATGSPLNALLKRLVSKRALTQADFDTVIELTIQKIVDAIEAEAITVFLKETDGIHFANVYYSETLYEKDPALREKFAIKANALRKIVLKPGQGIVGKAIESGKPYLALDAKSDPNFAANIDKDTGFDTRSMITVPLTVDGETIGAIQALNKRGEGRRFSETDMQLLEEVATYSGRMIQRIRKPDKPVDEKEMALYVSRLTQTPLLVLDDKVEIDDKILKLVGEPVLRRYMILPLRKPTGDTMDVAISNPLDIQRRDAFEAATHHAIAKVFVSSDGEIKEALDRAFKGKADVSDVAAKVREEYGAPVATVEATELGDVSSEESAPIVQLANRIIENAYAQRVSDIHIEPFEKEILVRYRVDGSLAEVLRLPVAASRALASRFKIMSELDISERRLPQDGRIQFKRFTKTGIDIDLRVSTAPCSWGEKIVMRILDKSGSIVPLEGMGFSERNITVYRDMIKKPYGMILHVGPTGSGKTTTLYSALNEINTPDINIQTAEDPIEYQLKGINQMQMHAQIGLTFARALRCFLRQDPDVILVGEIRDHETAEIGIEAALTGHLLFSTMHTNDAAGTVTRFVEMGIEPFLVSSSLLCVCAQRLMRRLCPKCKEPYKVPESELAPLGVDWGKDVTLHKPKGCASCNGNGFKGRIGVHELLTLNDEIKHLTNQKAPAEAIRKAAISAGMITLYQDALEKARKGVTSLDEALMTVRKE